MKRRRLFVLVLLALASGGFRPLDLTSSVSPVADAAMERQRDVVRTLLQGGGDVNAAQGDGMTALHWAALSSDTEMAEMLLYAGANVKAKTRLQGYTPLFLASRVGDPRMVSALLRASADVNETTASGASPLMVAAASGQAGAVSALVEAGADVNAAESGRGQTALMFAAFKNRTEVIDLLAAHGADVTASSNLVDVPKLSREDRAALGKKLQQQRSEREKAAKGDAPEPPPAPEAEKKSGGNIFAKLFSWMKPGGKKEAAAPAAPRRRRPSYGDLVGMQGGMTPLLIAARQGHRESVHALLRAGADINRLSEASHTSPLLIATMNGHFDLALDLLGKGADPTLANSPAGVTPLYAAINIWYAPHTSYPQPQAHRQQRTTHLELMRAFLDEGADPNAALQKKIWFSAYNFDQSGIDETGATAFWRAAYGSDVAAMELLKSYGANPTVTTKKPPERPRVADQRGREIQDVSGVPPVPEGGPALNALHAASGAGYGEGFAANEHRNHPAGFLPAVRYLVEECALDVNSRDHEGNTAMHNAAARGDVALIDYLVSRGADVTLVNREGQTTADMANGPVQRIQPFPEALERLTSLGALNNNKCVSC